jgi:hypothetical protein
MEFSISASETLAATSNASIATCHAVVSCSDLVRLKIYVWRLPAFAASCLRARQPADQSADPKTRRQLR